MNETIHLKNTNIPRMLGALIHKNEMLKFFTIASLLVSILALFTLSRSVSKAPLVIPLAENGDEYKTGTLPNAEVEIKKAITAYLNLRYRWEPKTVDEKLKAAEKFIAAESLKAYQTQITQVARFSKEKLVSQKVYPIAIDIDLENKKALVTGDRITSIQGLKATGDLILQLEFQGGNRSHDNPWGIYITKEKEANP